MGDSRTLGQLKNQYRMRFYRKKANDLPELQRGTNVLSAINDYFNEEAGENLPGCSRSSFLDSVTNVNTPESIQNKQGSSSNPCISGLNLLPSTGEINETKIKGIKSPTVNIKVKTTPCFNNFDVNVDSEEENDCESDMPLNLVFERGKKTEIAHPVRNLSRNQIYSSDSSVVQGPPSPASKTSPQKRLSFIDTVANKKGSFASVFASRYKIAPADDVPTVQMFHSPGTSTTPAECVPNEDDEEFIIEDEQSINMSFSSVNKRSSFGSSKETRSTASSSTHGNQKLQRKVFEVFQKKSSFCLSRGQPTRTENSPNLNRNGSNEESKNISNSERLKETKMTSPRAIDESQKLSIKSKAVPEQSLPYSKTVQQTRQTNKELELADEDNFNQNWDSNRESIKIPRSLKSKAERPKSSSDTDGSPRLFVKPSIVSEQSLTYLKPAQQTIQANKESELDLEDIFNHILDTNCEKIKIPRTSKPKAGRPKSSSVSHQMVASESTETVSEQWTVQSQTVKNTLRDDKRNKAKDTLCKDKNSFTSHLVKTAVNIEPPIKRMDTDYFDLPVVAEDEEFVIHDITDRCSDSTSWLKKTKKIPNDCKKTKKMEKNVSPEVLNVTYISAQKSDNKVTDSRKSLNDDTDSSSPLKDKKQKTSRPTEIDKLVLGKYLQFVDCQNETTLLRPKRRSAPPSTWWVVKQFGRNSIYEIEEALPQNSPKRKVSAESKEPLEWQSSKEESFELKERSLLDQNEELKESEEKSSKTLNTRKRAKKPKPVESEKMTGPSKVKRPKINKAPKKSQHSTKLCKQLEDETQESGANPPTNEPPCRSPQRHKPILDECAKKSSTFGSAEEREPQPQHRLPGQSLTSPVYDSAKLTFQSGPVLKTRAARHNSEIDDVVRNLTSAECLYTVDQSPMSIVRDPDTNSDALAECIHHANSDEQGNPPLMSVCLNNPFFSTGKCILRPMEEETRDTPMFDILVFYIVRGKILLKLHKSYHHLHCGDFFFIPPNNTFEIQNHNTEDAELIFTQLKTESD